MGEVPGVDVVLEVVLNRRVAIDAGRPLLARADRLYEESLGDARMWLATHIARFQTLLEGQDTEQIGHAQKELGTLLDRFDVQQTY